MQKERCRKEDTGDFEVGRMTKEIEEHISEFIDLDTPNDQVHLIGDYFYTVDSMGVNLTKKSVRRSGKKAGQTVFLTIGYYRNLEQVLHRLSEELQKERIAHASGLDDAVRIVKMSNEEVKQLIKEAVGWNT